MSDLAIIKEALAREDQQFVFESPMYKGQPIHRKAMADALRGTKHEKNEDKTKTPGLGAGDRGSRLMAAMAARSVI
ncbi:hypothetical protein [Bradyrhizobium sp. WSM471]|uniref:hypothetical protein n=1 Tax=Bradyrhizobium sp. WSM471 TaxID=319017 RepID=UPI001E4F7FF9|nr:MULTISPECIES: hypothetical protein [Bradyrhizobium]UFW40044.1 hypothetical protein BcanWSM471_28055 [Bradyrhizobium canariense]